MRETLTANGRDAKTGQFVKGFSGGPGRKVGSRNKLGEAFVEDLKTVWEEDGIDALRRCARDDATGFCRIIAGLMPKSVDLSMSVTLDAVSFAERFRTALELLHSEPQMKTVEKVTASDDR